MMINIFVFIYMITYYTKPPYAKIIKKTNPADAIHVGGFELLFIDAPKGYRPHSSTCLGKCGYSTSELTLRLRYSWPNHIQDSPKIDRNSETYSLYSQGWSVPKLSREYGISKPRVYQILKNNRQG